MALTDYEKRQVLDMLDRSRAEERRSATSSQGGFFSWLKAVGLGYIISKLIDLVWSAIKRIFGFLIINVPNQQINTDA